MNPYGKCLACYQVVADKLYHPSCAKKVFGTDRPPTLDLSSEDIEELAEKTVNRSLTVTGVQRKLSLKMTTGRNAGERLKIVDLLGGTHIVKPPTDEYPHMPEIENLTMHLADLCKIRTAPHALLPMKDGKLAYITRRFDRQSGKKIAVEDLCQLSNVLTEQKYNSSAERVGKVIRQHSSNPGDDALRYFELTVFCFLIGNADMHMKNFSLVTDRADYIHLSPSYDLLSTRLLISEKDDPDELALSVQGKKSSLKKAHFLFLADNLKLPGKTVEKTLSAFFKKGDSMQAAIENGILNEDLKADYIALLRSRLKRLKDE